MSLGMHVNHQLPRCRTNLFFNFLTMRTLYQYASNERIISLIIKERIKCSGKYARRVRSRADKSIGLAQMNHKVDDADENLSKLDLLTSMMPSRNSWVRPHSRDKFKCPDGKIDVSKLNAKSIAQAIRRDRKLLRLLQQKAVQDPLKQDETALLKRLEYLGRLDRFVSDLRNEIKSDTPVALSKPLLKSLFKNSKRSEDGTVTITFRPLSVYVSLHDKIILALASNYLTSMFNWYLRKNILSYRSARRFLDKKHHVTDFNDGIELIRRFREGHKDESIYVADCDIMKFYDTINHNVVRECFSTMLAAAHLDADGRSQVMRILDAYLNSYNFYQDVQQKSLRPHFWDRAKNGYATNRTICKFDWVGESDFYECYGGEEHFLKERDHIGVPQGGSLSLIIANVVLNDVDWDVLTPDMRIDEAQDSTARIENQNALFIRFCDDMVLMHTDKTTCKQLMDRYCQSLKDHRLIYHPFTPMANVKNGASTKSSFWKVKSHEPFCWRNGEGNASAWIGFLGYEMHRDGSIRLRKSNCQKIDAKIDRQESIMRRKLSHEGVRAGEMLKRFEVSQSVMVNSLKYYTGLENANGNRHFRRQLLRMEQKRKRMVRYVGCRCLSAKCELDGYTRTRLSKEIRKYTSPIYGFNKPVIPKY